MLADTSSATPASLPLFEMPATCRVCGGRWRILAVGLCDDAAAESERPKRPVSACPDPSISNGLFRLASWASGSARIRGPGYAELFANGDRDARADLSVTRDHGPSAGRGHATSCAWHVPARLPPRAGAGGAPRRVASRRQREFEQFAVGVSGLIGLWLEHELERVDHVLARL